ncbi:tyrosine-type recombinase/integrase [Photobacterium indicum]|uniref:tyrosine-type recombinase/integrase n=1 Tax=Photobacterium indicum TaxID=81447 RepID=UPI003D0B788E
MAENKLTDKKLQSLLGKPNERQVTLADGLGLSARVSVAGGISWLFRFRLSISNKQVWVTLGKYPDVSLKQARVERDKCREWVAGGRDPRIERKIAQEQALKPISVQDALEYWIEKYAENKRANSKKHESQFKKWIYPKIGHLPLSQISKFHWLSCFEDNAKKHPVAAGYILRNVQQALKFCKKRGYELNSSIFDIDFDSIGAKKQAKRSRRLIEDDSWCEFVDLLSWLDEGRIMPYYKNLIFLLIVFGSRTQEVRLSKVNEWDFKTMVWTVPPNHNKTKHKDQSRGLSGEIKRPIPESIAPYLKQLCSDNASGYLLGELKQSEAVSAWGGSVWKKLGHDTKWGLHDLRRTVATGMNDIGVAPHIVESLLGHTVQGVAGIYNHSQYLPEKKKALDLWWGKLEQLRSGDNVFFLHG